MNLKDRAIVVVGGTSGIGLAGAQAFLEAGANVVAVGPDADSCARAREALGGDCPVVQGDARHSETADRAVREAVKRFGRLGGLFHVAGGSGRKYGDAPLHEISDEGWKQTFDLNLTSVFYSNRAAVKQFLEQGGGGSVLNVTSVLAWSPAEHFFCTHAYASAKAGIAGLTLSAAAHYAKHNIRFNAIAPALTETPMSRRAMGNEEIMRYIATKQPLDGGRPGRSDDLIGAAVFFLSEASAFVTGQVLAVDGGWCVSEGQYKG